MEFKEIIERNYEANVKRGKIKPNTGVIEFAKKLEEEYLELLRSFINYPKCDPHEMADIILVVTAMAKHFGIDIQKAMEEKTIINEERAKNGK